MIIGQRIKRGAGKENPSLTIGSTSSKKEPRAFTLFNVTTPLDQTAAMQSMRDKKSMFYMMLNRFRSQDLITHLKELALAINQ